MIDKICDATGEAIAILIRPELIEKGVKFFTEPNLPMQVAIMSHSQGHKIPAHTHNPRSSHINTTSEVLLVQSGKLSTTLYSNTYEYIETRILNAGDIIVIMSGGHSFEVIEDCVFFEVKQGPYDSTKDKTIFG
jgi:cupin fold WbuC family metalloprotein